MRKIPTKKAGEGPVCVCPKEEKDINVYDLCFTCTWKYVYNKAENYVMCDWRGR